jgi:Glyoxalase-like domain
MAHYSRICKIVIDVPEETHDREVAFWEDASGKPLTRFERYPEYHGAELNEHLGLLIQRLGSGEARVHLDIHTDNLEAEVKRLQGLGAQEVERIHSWVVMRDPAGLLFCVIPDRPGTLDDSNAQRWG